MLKYFLFIFFLISLSLYSQQEIITYKNADTIIEIEYVYDTLVIQPDTIYYTDTVYEYDEIILEPVGKNLSLFCQPYIGILFSFGKYGYDSDLEIQKSLNNAVSSDLSLNAGARFGIQYKNYLAISGISFSVFNEEFWNKPLNVQMSITTYSYTDTVESYYIVYNNDTTTYYVTKKQYYDERDSAILASPFKNSYYSIGIPLLAGFSFNYDKFNINLLLEGNLQFYIKNSEPVLTINNNEWVREIDKKNELNFTYISYGFIIQGEYRVSSKLKLFIESGYHKTSNLYKKSSAVTYFPGKIFVNAGMTVKLK